ncbi:DUF2834 domain-containing protein [Leptolyngbya sp. AN03gr2]|uniref:DUF2834 domain-containing protein n=1 Tax=unclassified Leptolyngbya TaxID=2650499 RepID=UPI003D3159BF
MSKKILLALVWIGFVGYAFTLAPPDRPETFELIKNLSTLNVEGINPLIVALFNIMGVLPMAYACITFLDGRSQKIPAWFFTLFSFGVGVFSLLPYLIFRQPAPTFTGQKNWFLRVLDSRITGAAIALGGIGLFIYGVTNGDWSNFVQQWQTSRFIHVMSLDFCLLCALFPVLLQDDMKRRGVEDSQVFKILSFIPFFGALIYLVLRPPTIEQSTAVSPSQVPAT